MRVPKRGGRWCTVAVGVALACWVCAGCGSRTVVLRSERFTAIPIFIPDAKVSEDRTTVTVGHTALSLKGDAAEVGGELLNKRQAANLG